MKIKYYLVESLFYNNGTKDGVSMYTYDTEDEAITRFHKELGGWRNKPEVDHVMCMVIDSNGNYLRSETWTRSTETNAS